MDNINVVVLVVALVFVAVGVVLIAVSALVGRGGGNTAPVATANETEPTVDEEGVLFIDEPLATDLGAELGAKEQTKKATSEEEPTAEEATPTEEVAEPAPEEVEDFEAAAAAPAEEAAPTEEVAEPAPEEVEDFEAAAAAPAVEREETGPGEEEGLESVAEFAVVNTRPAGRLEATEPASQAESGVQSFDFTMRLGFKYLSNRLYGEAVAEFQKAATLTNDSAKKLHMFTEVGDAFRELGMTGPACAAYLQATAYTEDPQVQAKLEKTIAETSSGDLESVGGKGSTGSEEE